MHLRRCTLAVPGAKPRMMEKAAGLEVDALFLDLEDSVAPDERSLARTHIVHALSSHAWGDKAVLLRINAVSSRHFYNDLITVLEGAGQHVTGVIVPKVNRPEEVYAVAALLAAIEANKGYDHRFTIEAQIESAEGLINAAAIARASRRLTALIFGPGDYAADIGAPTLNIGAGTDPAYPGHLWHYALSSIINAAKAAGLEAIDGPYANIPDLDGLARSSAMAAALGCDGKWAVHPSQIETVQIAFSPTAANIERARAIVERYERATTTEGRGAAMLDAQMIDAASVRMAERTLEKARRAGLT